MQPFPGRAPAPPPPQKKPMSTCLIILLVMAVLAVPALGCFGALGIFGVRRYLGAAKTAEARNNVGAIARSAVAAYERGDASGKHRLCKSATPVPTKIPAATKYAPSAADWSTGDADTGWTCLKFSITESIHYQYDYALGGGTGKSGATADGFEATARGDVDGNGVTSLFASGASVRDGAVVVSREVYVENEFE